jgi:hypothetical protein
VQRVKSKAEKDVLRKIENPEFLVPRLAEFSHEYLWIKNVSEERKERRSESHTEFDNSQQERKSRKSVVWDLKTS